MSTIAIQLLVQVILILINAFFAATEISVISLNANKLRMLEESGDKLAPRLLKMLEQPAGFLSTIQIGITLAGFLGSAFAADSFSEYLVRWICEDLGFTALPISVVDTFSVVVITLILSYFTLIFGELVPKRIAMQKSLEMARLSCRVVSTLAFIARPVVALLSLSTNGVLRLLRMKTEDEEEQVTEDEIRMMIDLGNENGAIDAEEKELLQNLKTLKDNGTFKKIIVLINSSNAIEMDFLNPEICGEDYGIDSAMWIGDVGQTGINGVGQLLSGAVTPSGSLVDTYLYDNMANPAMYNFYTQAYPNAADYNLLTDGPDVQGMYSVYQEGIYLGYRYFETRYEDVVMGTAKAGDYNWATTVAYPFGYGDSYTTFAYSNFNVTESDDAFTVTLKVTNTGKTFSGKETVQIYFQSPYTAYDKANGIEKAAAELCGFAKTDVLAPGASEDVTITVPKSELRTYDANNAKTYIVDAGDYYFTAATDAHNAVNNILAAKGYTVENTNGRMTENGSTDLVWKWTNDTLDTTTFSTGANGTAITNLFDESDPNKSSDAPGSVTWMSRSDWTGTIPTAPAQLTANETLAASLAFTKYDGSEANSVEMPTLGAKNGLTLALSLIHISEPTRPY